MILNGIAISTGLAGQRRARLAAASPRQSMAAKRPQAQGDPPNSCGL
jgi:hypothetical protein